MAPPRSFNYALFSLTDVNTKNNDHIVGDVWSNGSVTVDQNDIVDGSINAATGWVFLDNNSLVRGDVWSGGADGSGNAVTMSGGAKIEGNVKASSTAPDCADDPGYSSYRVKDGTVTGNVTTWGNISGTIVGGVASTHVCTAAPATKQMPAFVYNPANYPAPQSFSSPSEFNAYVDTHDEDLVGTFYVSGGGANDWVDLTDVEISGDTTIIATDAPIDANGISGANEDDKILVLISGYKPAAGTACTDNGGNPADCAIGLKNNFQPEHNTAVLVYAPNGPVAFKNSAEFLGAVYANDIVVKNNMDLVYDSRVDQIVGFGPVTLARESWIEDPD
jgi:hypothetical protein